MKRRRIRFDQLVTARNLPEVQDGAAAPLSLVNVDVSTAALPTDVQKRPRDMSLREWVVYLLHNAAEVEHALMVQYLYAMYSLNEAASGPAANDAGTTVSASTWIPILRGIAIEEMGHLLTVQNVLRFVGGALSLAREDFPIDTNVYPFPFQLEPLTKDVLAKYVYAEMPAGDIDTAFLPAAEKAEIETRAKKAAGAGPGSFANHVGILYSTLIDALSDPACASTSTDGFPHDTATFQSTAGVGWSRVQGNGSIRETNDDGTPRVVKLKGARLLTVDSIGEALAALRFVARQGEASDTASMRLSHFGRFLDIYRPFPEANAAGWSVPPAFAVSTNPTPVQTPVVPGSTITNNASQLWARLLDLRYRALLATLAHCTAIPQMSAAPAPGSPTPPTPTAALNAVVTRVFSVMLEAPLSVAELAKLLAQMPRTNTAADGMAGAPFTMPYSLPIPDRDRERWQLQLDLVDSVAALVAELKKVAPDPAFPSFGQAAADLDGLLADDADWRTQVLGFLNPGS